MQVLISRDRYGLRVPEVVSLL